MASNLYVHFPFCRSRCSYRTLYSRARSSSQRRADHVAGLVREIEHADALAANDKYVFISPNDWTGSGETISRMDAKTGKYLPYAKDGDMPLSLQKFFKLKANARVPRIVAMTITGRGLLILSDDDALRIVDPDTGDTVRTLTLHATRYVASESCPFAADDDTVYTFFGRELQVTDLASGESRLVPLTSGFFGRTPAVERPSAIAVAGRNFRPCSDKPYESVQEIMDPESGIGMTLVDYVDGDTGNENISATGLFNAAVGVGDALVRITNTHPRTALE